jgi:hypothetical protein
MLWTRATSAKKKWKISILFSGKTELQEQWNSDNKRPLFAMDFPLFL